jgi:hypothetical protein
MLHGGEYWAERIGNLGHGGYLPVEVPAVDTNEKGIIQCQWYIGLSGINRYVNSIAFKVELSTVEPEVFYSPDELQELWNGKRELLEVANFETLEARSGDPTKNRF